MSNDSLDDALRACFDGKFEMDERFRAETVRMIYEKQERRNDFLLCLIQTAMCVLSIFAMAAASFFNRGITLFLLSYAVTGNLVSVIVILIFKYNNHRKGQLL